MRRALDEEGLPGRVDQTLWNYFLTAADAMVNSRDESAAPCKVRQPGRTVLNVFVRVVERPVPGCDGTTVWWLETPGSGDPSQSFSSRAEAIEAARLRAPDWLEVGEVVPPSGTASRHHRWTALRRDAGG